MTLVPCNGCVACCVDEEIILSPEHGDKAQEYATEPASNGARMLAHKANGECVYLISTGCSIHGRAPWACKQFDCRSLLLRHPLDQLDPLLEVNDKHGAILRAAHRLIDAPQS